jgi:signal transduction histidine kinase
MRPETTTQKPHSQGQAPRGTAEAPAAKPRGKDPLLSAICHDLRAPLAAVTMGAIFVLSTTPESDATGRSRRVLEAMLRSCKQMERLVRDFGDLSEIEADVLALRVGVHNVGELVEIAAEAARPSASARGVSIALSRPEEPIVVRCDRERILRALDHVIDNATRFAPQGSFVELAVRSEDDVVAFTVTDHGGGLSDETLAHLYDRTWHAKHVGRSGAGLGLAVTRGLIEAHGGRVEVDSKPGLTRFTLVIPKQA